MNGTSDEIFAHAAFSAEQNGRVGGRDAFNGSENFLHFAADGDDVRMAVFLPQSFAQGAVLFTQARVVELLMHHHPHLGERKRLEDVIAGAGFHRLDRRLHRAERSHDDDRQRRILLLGGL